MRYVAIDFETGNHKYISACSIGLAYYDDSVFLGSQSFLIRPPESAGKFHWYNVKIHGIEQEQLGQSPTFAQIWSEIKDKLEGAVILCHNAVFDTAVLCECLEYYQLPLPNCSYLCTVKIAQKVWPQLENHKLNTVAASLGISLNHHQAQSDAIACGEIFQLARKKVQANTLQAFCKQLEIHPCQLQTRRKSTKET